ncbi:MAG: hypothetical protein GX267_06515 [Fibrobacter sp.]|jgi:hypothetical protein|nr:hypothetical protein [Fibrobacter sp.]
MHEEKCRLTASHSLLQPVFKMFHPKKMDRNIWRRKKREKTFKRWKRAIMWAAFYGALNGVFKFLLSEGKRKLSFRK